MGDSSEISKAPPESAAETAQARSARVSDLIEIEAVAVSQASFARSPFALTRVDETEVNFSIHRAYGMTDRSARKFVVVVRFQAIGRLSEDAELDVAAETDPFEAPASGATSEEDLRQMFFIQAEFSLIYAISSFDGIDDDAIQAFASINGVFNAWPFWREFVHNTSVRMGLPALTAPVHRV